ncbi:MAG: hypothetical protein M1818_006690 [Claussenomyces sp. TS43310]|nr:MAG: hypothetical protein M1818_006690 [Claussenomyces sp. TS43310]
MNTPRRTSLKRKDDRVIIHFDYDCFYASVFENEDPRLKSLPLAVQQKQIIVTCNYEARRRGLHKLQLIVEARKVCPDVVIVLGEQLDRFRDASKMLYKYLEAFTWNNKVEKLGFDEVFMDVTDIVAYNQSLLNVNDLEHAFFQLSREDPTLGFSFDATSAFGHTYPEGQTTDMLSVYDEDSPLLTRLILGSHLARHIRHQLEENKGYTSTVGISTSKLLAKLVGNLHKPKGQTTLLPPYDSKSTNGDIEGGLNLVSNVSMFIDAHDIGKIPGIGFKMSQKIRSHILSRPAVYEEGLIYGATKDPVIVLDVRTYPGMGPELLERLLGGPGAERGIGGKSWGLINGVDDTEVRDAKKIPSQISIEDSYKRLDTLAQINKELRILSISLLKRMHTDLLEDDEDEKIVAIKRWIAHPKTIRLTTRPREPLNADGTRTRNFSRISRSGPLPNFVFDLREGVDALAEKLVRETLIPMFKRLHPEADGWNLSLMNVGVTNMVETASTDGTGGGGGRDIGRMFKRQEEVLKDWKVLEDKDVPPDLAGDGELISHSSSTSRHGSLPEPSPGSDAGFNTTEPPIEMLGHLRDGRAESSSWEDGGNAGDCCHACGVVLPAFAMAAHERYHRLGDN